MGAFFYSMARDALTAKGFLERQTTMEAKLVESCMCEMGVVKVNDEEGTKVGDGHNEKGQKARIGKHAKRGRANRESPHWTNYTFHL